MKIAFDADMNNNKAAISSDSVFALNLLQPIHPVFFFFFNVLFYAVLPFKELFAYAVQLSIDGHRSLVLPKRHLFGSDFSFQLLSLRLNSITTKSSLPFSFSSVLVKMPLFHVLISSRASQELLERSRLLQYFMGDYGLYY